MVVKVGRSDVNAVPMTDVRPRLTEIIDKARDRGTCTALTEYSRPRAFVVPVPFFEQAERDAEVIARLRERHPELLAELELGLESIAVPMKISASKVG